MFAAESYISAIAEHLKLDIDHVRSVRAASRSGRLDAECGVQINLYQEGDRTHFLQLIGPSEWHVPRLLDELKVDCDYERRKAEIKRWNAEHRYRKRGICMMPTKVRPFPHWGCAKADEPRSSDLPTALCT